MNLHTCHPHRFFHVPELHRTQCPWPNVVSTGEVGTQGLHCSVSTDDPAISVRELDVKSDVGVQSARCLVAKSERKKKDARALQDGAESVSSFVVRSRITGNRSCHLAQHGAHSLRM